MPIDQYDPALAWLYAEQLGLPRPRPRLELPPEGGPSPQGWSFDLQRAQQAPPAPPPAPPPPPPPPQASELPPAPVAFEPQGPPAPTPEQVAAQPGEPFQMLEELPPPPLGFTRPPVEPEAPGGLPRPQANLPEPWERAAAEEDFGRDRTRRRAILEGATDIAEGLGSITGPFTAGSIMAGSRGQRPLVAESLRRAAGGISDEIGPTERQTIKERWGLDLPPDAKWSRVREQLPEMTRVMHGGVLDAYKRASLDMQARKEQGIQGRFDKTFPLREDAQEFAKEKFHTVGDTDRRSLAGSAFLLESASKMEQEFEKVASILGPVGGRYQVFARLVGASDPKATAMIARISFLTSQFIYEMTGKQLNESEMHRLEKVLPQYWDSPEQFRELLRSFTEISRSKYDTQIRGLRAQGKDVSAFEDPTAMGIEAGRAERGTATRRQEEIEAPAASTGVSGVGGDRILMEGYDPSGNVMRKWMTPAEAAEVEADKSGWRVR